MKSKIKAIGLYSGGLDSILAVKAVLDGATRPIEIVLIRFITAFFDYKDEEEFEKEKKYIKEKFNINLKVIDITENYLKILDKPKYGYGKNLNPCIDCKILMLKKAEEIMKKEKANFIFTGEVVGQRPKSQKMNTMRLIEKGAGLEGYLLRPLSAQLLKETIPEKDGLVDRKKMLAINGRSRKEQLAMAKKNNIKYFATPSGGCLLTDKDYSRKLSIVKDEIGLDAHILKFVGKGRLFIIDKNLFIVGRNDLENKKLLNLSGKNDLLFQPEKIPGPLCAFVTNSRVSAYLEDEKKIKVLACICAKYTVKSPKALTIQYDLKKDILKDIQDLKTLKLSYKINIARNRDMEDIKDIIDRYIV
ncbi:tRNA 4-thiouridine(8) synthase ThiI [Patescibacteria group bacterium]